MPCTRRILEQGRTDRLKITLDCPMMVISLFNQLYQCVTPKGNPYQLDTKHIVAVATFPAPKNSLGPETSWEDGRLLLDQILRCCKKPIMYAQNVVSWALSLDRGRNRRSFDCKHVSRFRVQGRDQSYYCVVKPIHMLSIYI